MYREKIVNSVTAEETWRDYTSEEIAEVEAAQAKAAERAAKEAQAEAKRQVALAKLAALGLEEDDVKALGL